VLSITTQPLISSTTDLALQDATLRNITASASAFTLKGGLITLIKDNLGNTLMDIQNSRVEFLKPVNVTQPINAYNAVTIQDTVTNRTGQLWIASGNKLQWNGQEVPDLPSTSALVNVRALR
jgi:hypothetical protein